MVSWPVEGEKIAAVHLVFMDDAKQQSTRPGMGPLVAAGAICINADYARHAERALKELCQRTGFPDGEEFKWSPRRNSWMHENLVEGYREQFFTNAVQILTECGALGVVVAEDEARRPANRLLTHEQDVVVLVLERVANRLKELGSTGLVVADRPGGGRSDENRFLAQCLTTLETGTDYVQHNEISFVISTDSRHVRLLQAADLLASCVTAYLAGETRYSPAIAGQLMKILPAAYGRRGGYSVKLHPDFLYANLYHWLLGDTDFVRFQNGWPLPMQSRSYAKGPETP